MNWADVWMSVWGQTVWLGLDIGFWAAMMIVVVLVVLMNGVFWGMGPKGKPGRHNLGRVTPTDDGPLPDHGFGPNSSIPHSGQEDDGRACRPE